MRLLIPAHRINLVDVTLIVYFFLKSLVACGLHGFNQENGWSDSLTCAIFGKRVVPGRLT